MDMVKKRVAELEGAQLDWAVAKKPAPRRPRTKAGKPAQWTRNRGEAPVGANVYVEVRLRNGNINRGPAGDYVWRIDGKRTIEGSVDIMAWRRVRKPRADKGTKLGRTLADLAASKHPRLEATGDGKVHLDLGVGTVRMPVTADVRAGELGTVSGEPVREPERRCQTCRHGINGDAPDESSPQCEPCFDGMLAGHGFRLWEPIEPVRHFDRSDEPKRPYTEEISHPLADQLDPTTPARPVFDEHRDGDSDGLGCARAAVWSLVGIFAVALAFVGIRALMGG